MNKGLYKISPRRQQRELELNKVILYIIYFLMTKAFRSFLETDEDRYHNVYRSGALSRRWKVMSVEERVAVSCNMEQSTESVIVSFLSTMQEPSFRMVRFLLISSNRSTVSFIVGRSDGST